MGYDIGEIRKRVTQLSDDDLQIMVNKEYEKYTDEAMHIAEEEMKTRDFKINRDVIIKPAIPFNSAGVTSSLPMAAIGFAFAGAFITAEIVETSQGIEGVWPFTVAIGFLGLAYWLFCIHRIHKILREGSASKYPISPNAAAWYHLIPIYGIFWLYKWPKEYSDFINSSGRVKMMAGSLISPLLYLSFTIAYVYGGGISLILLFGMTIYMSSRLRALPNSKPQIVPDPIETA
jgi:hypothetical protein